MYQTLSSDDSFVSIESFQNVLKKEYKNKLFVATFRRDSKSITYQRTVMSFLDVCGLIGGVNEILRLVGSFIVSSISGKILVSSLLSALYQVRADSNNGSNINLNNLNVPHEHNNRQNVVYKYPVFQKYKPNLYSHKQYKDKTHASSELIQKAVNEMKSRSKFNYSISDVVYNVIWPFKWLKFAWLKVFKTLKNRYRLYLKGQNKLLKELSVVQFVKMQHRLNLLVRLLLDRQGRLLAAYQQTDTLGIASNSAEDCSDNSDEAYLTNLLDNSDAKHIYSEFTNKFFEDILTSKQSEINFKLLHGVWSNRELTQDQLEDAKAARDRSTEPEKSKVRLEPNLDFKWVSRSLNKTNTLSLNLDELHEESKVNISKISESRLKLREETNQNFIELFDANNIG